MWAEGKNSQEVFEKSKELGDDFSVGSARRHYSNHFKPAFEEEHFSFEKIMKDVKQKKVKAEAKIVDDLYNNLDGLRRVSTRAMSQIDFEPSSSVFNAYTNLTAEIRKTLKDLVDFRSKLGIDQPEDDRLIIRRFLDKIRSVVDDDKLRELADKLAEERFFRS